MIKLPLLFLTTFLLAFPLVLRAQEPVITYVQDSSITRLVEKFRQMNMNEPQIRGYRVQLASRSGNNSKKEANDIKTRFLLQHPDIPADVIWQSPNYKVRVGYFRDRYSAYRFFKDIKTEFPSSFIVMDFIGFPSLTIDDPEAE